MTTFPPPLIETIAKTLAQRGRMSSRDIGAVLGEPGHRIGDAMKAFRTRSRYGITAVGKQSGEGKGGPSNLWEVDEKVLTRYLAVRGPYSQRTKISRATLKAPIKPKPKQPTPKEPKADPNRQVPVYNGPHRTVWQSMSPYYKGANHENTSAAPSA